MTIKGLARFWKIAKEKGFNRRNNKINKKVLKDT